ncbi:MAG: glutamine amidotransferase, partial [Myxococcota bacterium]|nr:glutamine amidotransferase [Myxococcota bacterium]
VERTTVRRSVVLVLDGSASMGIREGDTTRATRMAAYLERSRPELEELADRADLQFWWAGDDPRPLTQAELAELPSPGGSQTDYLSVLDERIAAEHPAAVVLLGDGIDRAALGQAFAGAGGAGVGAATLDLAVPVSTVTFGGEVGGDLTIRVGSMAPFAFVRRPVLVPVAVEAEPGELGEVTVTLTRDGAQVGVRTVDLGPDGRGQAEFEVTPEQTGYLTLDVAAPTPAGDPLPGNNSDAVTLRVIRDRTRVLQLASHPSWDVRYLRRFLKTDPNIDLISFYILREAPLWGPYRNSPISLIEFPHRELFGEDLAGFDLVVLQNFSFESLPGLFGARGAYVNNLIEFVRDGGALLLVGGDRSLGRAESGALADVLPVELGAAGATAADGSRLQLTDAGARHPVTRLAGGLEANRGAWEALGPLGSYNDVGPARESAVVLATAGEGGAPALSVRQLDTGRLMLLASDGTWRWAMEGEGHAHTRFWRNAVRWLVRDEESGLLEVRPHAENVSPGETIRVACR